MREKGGVLPVKKKTKKGFKKSLLGRIVPKEKILHILGGGGGSGHPSSRGQ